MVEPVVLDCDVGMDENVQNIVPGRLVELNKVSQLPQDRENLLLRVRVRVTVGLSAHPLLVHDQRSDFLRELGVEGQEAIEQVLSAKRLFGQEKEFIVLRQPASELYQSRSQCIAYKVSLARHHAAAK